MQYTIYSLLKKHGEVMAEKIIKIISWSWTKRKLPFHHVLLVMLFHNSGEYAHVCVQRCSDHCFNRERFYLPRPLDIRRCCPMLLRQFATSFEMRGSSSERQWGVRQQLWYELACKTMNVRYPAMPLHLHAEVATHGINI